MNSNKLVTKTTNEQYYFVDILKFVCAILVIWIHTEPLKNLAPEIDFSVKVIARIAVLFFIAVQAFLFLKVLMKIQLIFQ